MLNATGEAGFPVAILAGGLATRMHPLTERIPKALLEVAGRPFIEHQLALLRREGVRRVVLCVGFLGEMIEARIGDGTRFGLSVSYSFDGERLLGTGGALRRALPMLGEHFFVLYGDSYLDIAYAPVQAAYRESGLPALMTVFRNEGRWDTSNVLYDGNKVVRYDKAHPTADMRLHRLWARHPEPQYTLRCRRMRHSTCPTFTPCWRGRADSPGSRRRSASTKLARRQALQRRTAI